MKKPNEARQAWLDFLKTIGDERHSQSLHAWMAKFARRFGHVSPLQMRAWAYHGRIFIGFDYDGDLFGCNLGSILSRAGHADIGCYPGIRHFRELKGWWARYQKRGVCALDAKHHLWRERWVERAGVSTCRYCGRQQKLVSRIEQKTVTSWVPVGKVAS